MNFKTVSRRDDLISLTYLLIIISEGGPGYLNLVEQASYDHFEAVKHSKQLLTPETMCYSKKSHVFLPFVRAVHALEF